MRHQGRSTQWLAGHLDVSQSMCSLIVRGRRPIASDRAGQVSNLLGVPVELLFRDMTETMQSKPSVLR
jgi:plasmid maintenance system antidote protein VapI